MLLVLPAMVLQLCQAIMVVLFSGQFMPTDAAWAHLGA